MSSAPWEPARLAAQARGETHYRSDVPCTREGGRTHQVRYVKGGVRSCGPCLECEILRRPDAKLTAKTAAVLERFGLRDPRKDSEPVNQNATGDSASSEGLGARVRQRRYQLKLSQVDLAVKAGMHQSVLSKIESGKQAIAPDLPALAKALSCTAHWLEFGSVATDSTGAKEPVRFSFSVPAGKQVKVSEETSADGQRTVHLVIE